VARPPLRTDWATVLYIPTCRKVDGVTNTALDASLPPAEHPHGRIDYDRDYELRAILDERRGRYLIDWEDDKVTGESYEPTWEPKRNANKSAVEDWERRKAQLISTAPAPLKRKKVRPRKVALEPVVVLPAQKSPDISAHRQNKVLEQSSPSPHSSHNSGPEIVESPKSAGTRSVDKFTHSPSPLFEPIVQPSDPQSSCSAGPHQEFTTLNEQTAGGQSHQEPVRPLEEQLQSRSVLVNSGDGPASTKSIPDSQALIDWSSSAPAPATSVIAPAVLPSSSLKAVPITPYPAISGTGVASATAETHPSTSPVNPAKVHKDLREDQLQRGSGQSPLVREEVERWPENIADTIETQDLPAHQPIPQTTGQVCRVSLGKSSEGVTFGTPDGANLQRHDSDPTHFRNRPGKKFEVASPTTLVTQVLRQSPPQSDRRESANQSSPSAPVHVAKLFVTTSTQSSPPILTQVERPLSKSTRTPTQFRGQLKQHFASKLSSFPGGQTLLDNGSSPIPSVPSRSIGTFGESAPPRLVTRSPSSVGSQTWVPEMEASQESTRSPASLPEKLAASRAERRVFAAKSEEPAKLSTYASQAAQHRHAPFLAQPPRSVSSLIAEEQARRSPSAIPAMNPLPTITQEEQNTSERYETLLPHCLEGSADNGQQLDSVGGSGTLNGQQSRKQASFGSTHRHLPLALVGHQRDQYSSMVWYHKDLIERFLTTPAPDAELLSEAECFVERMRRITLHPDLDNVETLTQYDVRPTQQAEWDVNCSAKFRFLRDLFTSLRSQNLHVTIISPPGRILGMMDTFLTGISVPHRRSTDVMRGSLCNDRDGLIVTIVSVEDEMGNLQVDPVDLLVVVDPVVTADHSHLETLMQAPAPLPIVLTLVVQGSVEHVEQSISMTLSRRSRMHAIVSGIWQYRDKVGKLDVEQPKFEVAANSIATYFAAHEGIAKWPIAQLAPLTDLDSQTDSDSDQIPIIDGPSNSKSKRPFEESNHSSDSTSLYSKKARLNEAADADQFPTTVNLQDIEITHISDSVTKPTQASASAEISLVVVSDNELRLQQMLKETQERLEEHVQALTSLQYRHEEQREKLVEVSNQRDMAIVSAQETMARLADLHNRVSTLKAERTELKQQLENMRVRLLDHSVPERAQYEALRLEVEQAQRAKEHLEQRLESAKKEAEYTREMYQSSSQSAQHLASQNAVLEKELASARNRATGEQARLRQMGYDAQAKRLRDENQKLKVLLKDREAGLKFRDEEISRLKEASRGRISTRGSSVPRSPRLGSPMKLDGIRSRGSRQGSPAAGDLKAKATLLHPLRNG